MIGSHFKTLDFVELMTVFDVFALPTKRGTQRKKEVKTGPQHSFTMMFPHLCKSSNYRTSEVAIKHYTGQGTNTTW